ncbi:MAG: methyltransferase domain-containing protein [Gemmatimonadota bacterium]|nr:methyltransferase domain-containing protein [Gemmatimonadota bacterium]
MKDEEPSRYEEFNYDSIAEAYAAAVDTAPYNALYERPAMLALLPTLDGARILDAGCGSGWYTEQLLRRGAIVTSIDASRLMADYTRERIGRLAGELGSQSENILVADLSKPLDFLEGETFDGILSPLVLHYLEEWRTPLREMRRVLKPDGWLLFSTHHPATESARFGTANYFEIERLEDEWPWAGKVEFYRRPLTEIFGSLADAAFVVERVVEPIPGDDFKRVKPESFYRLLRQPEFLIVLARPRLSADGS